MKLLTDISEYQEIIDRYNKKGVLSNDYLQKEANNLIGKKVLYADCKDHNAFLFVKKDIGMRMYYYINDVEDMPDFSAYVDLVTEILFRGELPHSELEYLSKCGFQLNVVRDMYGGVYKDLAYDIDFIKEVLVEKAQTLSDLQKACELFNNSFDKLSGDYITEDRYASLLDSGNILVAWSLDRTIFLGALHQTKEGSVNVIGHIAVNKEVRGQGVGKALVDAFVEWNKNSERAEKTRYQLWVQHNNEAAVNMYKKKGFKYLNKSTISLIK